MLRCTISRRSSNARLSAEPVTRSGVMTRDTGSSGPWSPLTTRFLQVAVGEDADEPLPSMTSSEETPWSRMTWAAWRTESVVVVVTGPRRTRSEARVRRWAVPRSVTVGGRSRRRLLRSKNARTGSWSEHSERKTSAGTTRHRESSMAVNSNDEPVRSRSADMPKDVPASDRSTSTPSESRMSMAPLRRTIHLLGPLARPADRRAAAEVAEAPAGRGSRPAPGCTC